MRRNASFHAVLEPIKNMYYIRTATEKLGVSDASFSIDLEEPISVSPGVTTYRVGEESLVISKNTGKWCYLSLEEWKIAFFFRGTSIREAASLLNKPLFILERFVISLVKRGLLKSSTSEQSLKERTIPALSAKPNRFILTLLLSNRCNLACKYCYHDFPSNYGKETISRELANSAFRYAFSQSSDELMIDFGEIAVNDQIFRKLFYDAKQMQEKSTKHLIYSIQTNGTTLNKKNTLFLKQNDFFVGLSLDGSEIVHDEMRVFPSGKGSHNLAVSGLNHLIDAEIPYIVNSTIHNLNFKQAREILNYFHELNIQHYAFKPILQRGSAVNSWGKIGLSAADYAGFLDDVVSVAIEQASLDRLDNSLITFCQRVFGDIRGWSSSCNSGYCQAGETQLVINTDGYCFPCPRFSSIGDGNLSLGSVESLIKKSDDPTPKSDNHKGHQVCLPQNCIECGWHYFCKGGCPITRGSSNGIPEMCSINTKMYELIFKKVIPRIRSGKFMRSNKLGEFELFQEEFFQQSDENQY